MNWKTSAWEGAGDGEPRGFASSSALRRHHVCHVSPQFCLTPFWPGWAGHHSMNLMASFSAWERVSPSDIAKPISGTKSAGSLQPRFLEEPLGSSFTAWSKVLGGTPVSVLVDCTCTALASSLHLAWRPSAAFRRFSMISSALANSASMRLWVQFGPNSIASTSRLSSHSALDMRARRANSRSSAGSDPFCQ